MSLIPMLALASALAAPAPGADDMGDGQKLVGTWVAKSVIISGNALQPMDVATHRVVISREEIIFKWGDKKEAPFRYKLNPAAKPKQIDLTVQLEPHKGRVSLGIYQLDGDKLTLCNNHRLTDKRPTEFKSMPLDGMSVYILERVKK
ncbi:MAG TPA: TIGR03067 domain-containing protein [Gemmataceae bacterium]|nr:TIGR03067 domain-containing protein [Gemmataceae bacterium]